MVTGLDLYKSYLSSINRSQMIYPALRRLSRTSRAIRQLYSHEKMYSSVLDALLKIEASCK